MKLQTKIPLNPTNHQFGYDDKLLLLGSCFSENIGNKLEYYKFQSVTNPFGIIFNPVALERIIVNAVANKTYTEDGVFEINSTWKSYYAHSDLNASSRLETIINLQDAQRKLRTQLQKCSHLFITLGTAWVYRHKESNEIVANCHKVPQKEFLKELLSVDQIIESLSKIVTHIKTDNPTIKVVFTISPVRHLKDGFIENQQSKAHLITAVHQIVKTHKLAYFPAYELMMDELRDYRFYDSDMIHPSPTAITYIWERFVEVYASAKAKETMQQVAHIQKGLAHKPFNLDSTDYQKHLSTIQLKITELQSFYPHIKF